MTDRQVLELSEVASALKGRVRRHVGDRRVGLHHTFAYLAGDHLGWSTTPHDVLQTKRPSLSGSGHPPHPAYV